MRQASIKKLHINWLSAMSDDVYILCLGVITTMLQWNRLIPVSATSLQFTSPDGPIKVIIRYKLTILKTTFANIWQTCLQWKIMQIRFMQISSLLGNMLNLNKIWGNNPHALPGMFYKMELICIYLICIIFCWHVILTPPPPKKNVFMYMHAFCQPLVVCFLSLFIFAFWSICFNLIIGI